MFIKNANLTHARRHHELLLPSRPYRGEPPTVAGFLLYPDTPAKMETTSREAFCFRPAPRHDRGKGDHMSTQQEAHRSLPTSCSQTGGGHGSRDGEPAGDEQEGGHDETTQMQVKHEQDTTEMKSQYQKDFPPQSSCRRRRTPALPQPDNIAINPAFRIDFSTIQRETFPGWPILNPRGVCRLRAASSPGQPNMTAHR